MSSLINVQPLEATLTSVWMLQPEYRSLRQALESKGYTIKDQTRGSLIQIATKGSIEIFSNIERRTIGIGSETSTRDLLIASEDLEQIYKEMGIEESNLLIYEFIGTFSATSTSSPLEKFKKLPIEQSFLRKIGSIMDADLVPLGLDLTKKDSLPTSPNFLQITIEPLYPSANTKFLIRTIYRGSKEEVISFIKKIDNRLKKVIEEIEGVI